MNRIGTRFIAIERHITRIAERNNQLAQFLDVLQGPPDIGLRF